MPEVGIVMQPSGEAPHTILDLNIKTGLTKSIKYAFAPTADVREELDNNGGSYESLIDMRGVALSAEQVAQANSDGGLTLKMDELWYDTEYTCVVCAVSAEQLSVVDHTAARTSAEPKPARVESELFALLPGKWSLSYDYVDLYKDPQRIEGAEITIADTDGAGSRYRDYNRLLVEGLPVPDQLCHRPHALLLCRVPYRLRLLLARFPVARLPRLRSQVLLGGGRRRQRDRSDIQACLSIRLVGLSDTLLRRRSRQDVHRSGFVPGRDIRRRQYYHDQGMPRSQNFPTASTVRQYFWDRPCATPPRRISYCAASASRPAAARTAAPPCVPRRALCPQHKPMPALPPALPTSTAGSGVHRPIRQTGNRITH